MNKFAVVSALTLWVAASAAAQSLQPLATIQAQSDVTYSAVSPTGQNVAAVGRDHKPRIWTLPTGKLLHALDAGIHPVTAMTFSRDGKRLAIGDEAGGVHVFDSATGAVVHQRNAGMGYIAAIALSPDGQRLAIAPVDRPVQLWDVNSRKRIAEMKAPFAGSSALAFSPNGKLMASADRDTVIRVYDAQTGQLRSRYESLLLESFTLDFSPDSKKLVVGGADNLAVAIDPETGKELRRLEKQPDPILGLAVLADGKTAVLVCFNADHMIEGRNTVAWNLDTGESRVVASGKMFNGGAATSDGRLILASSDGSVLQLWAIR